jgi:hypothetical protein
MRITIATGLEGHHKDWDINPAALRDTGLLQDEFAELGEYLDENDGDLDEEMGYRRPVDSGGRLRQQVWDALVDVHQQAVLAKKGPKRVFYKNMTLAVSSEADMDVQVKVDLDLD